MPNIRVSALGLKGPAGNAAPPEKRVIVSMMDLHGPMNKRILVTALSLEAPPPEKRVSVSQVQLVGPNSALKPVYRGTASGWQAVDVYIGSGGQWVKVV